MGVFGQHKLRYVLCAHRHGMCLSTHVEVNFVSSLALDGFGQHKLRNNLDLAVMGWVGQHKLRCILCPCWHWMSLVNTG